MENVMERIWHMNVDNEITERRERELSERMTGHAVRLGTAIDSLAALWGFAQQQELH